jgi:hypothetical protein
MTLEGWQPDTFTDWLAEWFHAFDPADLAYPESFAEQLVREATEAGWRVTRAN